MSTLEDNEALVLLGARHAEVQQKPVLPLRSEDVLVKVAAVGVCATDVELFDGTMGYFAVGLATWPLVPGHEWAGEIVALGEDAPSHLKVGQRVVGEHASKCRSGVKVEASCGFCSVKPGGFLRCPKRRETGFLKREGAFQKKMQFPAEQLHVLPDTVPWHQAVLAEPLSTAHKAVRLALGKPATRVVVIGDGPIGLLVVQILRWRGMHVAGLLGTNPTRLATARECGAQEVCNVDNESLSDFLKKIGEPEVVIEAAGHPKAVQTALECISPGGRVVLMGLSGNKLSQICADDIVLKQITIVGSLASEPEDWAAVTKMLASGAVRNIVTHSLPGLRCYGEAIEKVRKPPESMIKLIVHPQAEDSDEAAQYPKRARSAATTMDSLGGA